MALTAKPPKVKSFEEQAQAPRKPRPDQLTDEAFARVSREAAAAPPPAREGKENKKQISVTITPSQIARADTLAKRLGMGRAGILNMALAELLEKHGV